MTWTPRGMWLPSLGCPAHLPQVLRGWTLANEVPVLLAVLLCLAFYPLRTSWALLLHDILVERAENQSL